MIPVAIGVVIIIVTAIVSQAARESLLLLSGSLGPKVIGRAVKALPAERRVIREPEWLAEFQRQLDKGLAFASLTFAIGCMIGAHRIRREALRRVENDHAKHSGRFGALRRSYQPLIQGMAEGDTAAIVGMWISALLALPLGAWLISRPGLVLSGYLVLALCVIYALAGFGVLARRVQLELRKNRLSRSLD
jgi:hypothetical protein